MAERRSAKIKKHTKRQRYRRTVGRSIQKNRMVDATSSWHSVDQQSARNIRNVSTSTSNTSSRAGQQRQQHQRSSVKQQQDQNGNTENTNMISKMKQKPSARPKKYQNLVYCRLGESGFCYSPQRARALALTFQGTLRLNQRTSSNEKNKKKQKTLQTIQTHFNPLKPATLYRT